MFRIQFVLFCVILLYSCRSTTERLDTYAVQGIDISHHQTKIDWSEVGKQDFDFSFVKATEGISHHDSLFCKNWESIKQIGLRRGAYHFFRPTSSPLSQAQNFINLVEMEQGDMPPVLDVEVTDGVSKTVMVNRIKSWLDIVEFHYNIKPIIYTNLKFYYTYILGNFDDYPLWIAKYGYIQPQLANSEQWRFWQYGNRGRVKGVKGDVDLNVFYGSKKQLEAMCLNPNALLSDAKR